MDDILLAFWGRLSFYVLKLAMLFTIGRADYSEDTEVSLAHVKEACRQVDEYFLPIARIIADEVSREESKNVQNRIIGILSTHGGKMRKRDLLKTLHLKLKEVDDALEALSASEEIVEVPARPKGSWIILRPQTTAPTVASVPLSQSSHEFNDCNGNSLDSCDDGDSGDDRDSRDNGEMQDLSGCASADEFNHPLA